MAIKSSAVATFDINIALIPVNGQGAISTFVISLRSSIHGVFWFTDNVVGVIAYKGYGDSYYEVGTGRFLLAIVTSLRLIYSLNLLCCLRIVVGL